MHGTLTRRGFMGVSLASVPAIKLLGVDPVVERYTHPAGLGLEFTFERFASGLTRVLYDGQVMRTIALSASAPHGVQGAFWGSKGGSEAFVTYEWRQGRPRVCDYRILIWGEDNDGLIELWKS